MRIRTILAAAAAPAALAAVLLGTAAPAAHAATTDTLAAAVVKAAPVTVTANTHRHNVPDTTWDGSTWATDNLEQKITATQDAANSQLWHVTVDSTGSYDATANPIDGTAWTGSGPVKGTIAFDVTSTSTRTPAASNVNGNLPAGTTFTGMLRAFFGDQAATVAGGAYSFSYGGGIPGAPGGVYTQNG